MLIRSVQGLVVLGHLLLDRQRIGRPQHPAQRRGTGDARAPGLQLGDQFGGMLLRPVGQVQNRRLPGGQAGRQNGQQIGPGKHAGRVCTGYRALVPAWPAG